LTIVIIIMHCIALHCTNYILFYVAGQRRQTVRYQTDPDGERQACDNIYKSKVWRQPGCKAAAKISVAPESEAGVRPKSGWSQNGSGTIQEGAKPSGVGVWW